MSRYKPPRLNYLDTFSGRFYRLPARTCLEMDLTGYLSAAWQVCFHPLTTWRLRLIRGTHARRSTLQLATVRTRNAPNTPGSVGKVCEKACSKSGFDEFECGHVFFLR